MALVLVQRATLEIVVKPTIVHVIPYVVMVALVDHEAVLVVC